MGQISVLLLSLIAIFFLTSCSNEALINENEYKIRQGPKAKILKEKY